MIRLEGGCRATIAGAGAAKVVAVVIEANLRKAVAAAGQRSSTRNRLPNRIRARQQLSAMGRVLRVEQVGRVGMDVVFGPRCGCRAGLASEASSSPPVSARGAGQGTLALCRRTTATFSNPPRADASCMLEISCRAPTDVVQHTLDQHACARKLRSVLLDAE